MNRTEYSSAVLCLGLDDSKERLSTYDVAPPSPSTAMSSRRLARLHISSSISSPAAVCAMHPDFLI